MLVVHNLFKNGEFLKSLGVRLVFCLILSLSFFPQTSSAKALVTKKEQVHQMQSEQALSKKAQVDASSQPLSVLSLSDFLNIISEKNLDIKVSDTLLKAYEAKSKGLNIPPPTIMFNEMKMEAGEKANGFVVSQTLPFPSQIYSDYYSRQYLAQSQKEETLGKRKEILAQAKLEYIRLWAAQEKLKILNEKKTILQNHIKLSRSTERSDSFVRIHTIKAESDVDLLENEIEVQKQEIQENRFQIASLLNKDPSFSFDVSEPTLSEIPQEQSASEAHQIKAMELNLKGYQSKESEARSSWFPELTFSYKKMGGNQKQDRYSEGMIGISLPFLFFWNPNAESQFATSQRVQAELEYKKKKRDVESEKSILLSRVTALKKQLENLYVKIIPRAKERMRIAHNLTPRDLDTLQDHRETMEAFPDLNLKALDLRLNYEEAILELEKYSR